jgi:hypothetical protein
VNMKNWIRKAFNARAESESILVRVFRILRNLIADTHNPQLVPPGHFYSPIPSLTQLREDHDRIFSTPSRLLPDIDLDEQGQLKVLDELAEYYRGVPFSDKPRAEWRYYYENEAFVESDAIFLFCMLSKLSPRQVIEIGCGFSSAAILDTCDARGLNTRFTFIEPYPDVLRSLLRQNDYERINLVQQRIQEFDLGIFESLQPDDILFVDTTHVVKTGGDVNWILFEVLPRLKSGVYIQFHDIFYPFEYPSEWVMHGRAWNELYLLRAFLACNERYRIVLFNSFLQQWAQPFLRTKMPRCMQTVGGSLWLKKF